MTVRELNTIILAHPSAREYLSVLANLSHEGLTKPLAWCELDSGADGEYSLVLEGGRLYQERTQELLNDIHHHVRYMNLHVVGENYAPVAKDSLERFFNRHREVSQAKQSSYRLIVPWDRSTTADMTGEFRWTNLIVSPEITDEALDVPVDWNNEPERRLNIAVSALVSAANLWRGMDDQWDSRFEHLKHDTYVMKSFVRGVDARHIRYKLLHDVTAFDPKFEPLVSASNSELLIVPDSGAAAQGMARLWWQSIKDSVTVKYPPAPASEGQTNIGAWAAIKQYVAFLWAILKNLPRNWLSYKYRQIVQTVAGIVETTVYGSDSAYRVIVGGYDAQGRPASWNELRNTASGVMQRSAQSGHISLAQTGQIPYGIATNHFVKGALTLVDGQQGVFPALSVNNHPATIAHADYIGPSLEQWYEHTSKGRLAATDIAQIDYEIQAIQWDSIRTQATDYDRRKLEKRKNQLQQTYVGSVVGHVTNALYESQHYARQSQEQMAAIVNAVGQLGDNSAAKKPLKGARLVSLVTLILFVLLIGGWAIFDWSWKLLVGGSIVLVLAWLIGTFIYFQQYVRATAVQNRLHNQLDHQIPYLQQVYGVALQNIQRLADLMTVLEKWATIVSEFVHRPFGREPLADVYSTQFADLPTSVKFRETQLTPEDYEERRVSLRKTWLRQGWATDFWENIATDFSRLTTSEHQRQRVKSHSSNLYGAHADDGALGEILDNIKENGFPDIARQSVIERINLDDLPEFVEDDGSNESVSQFLQGIENHSHTAFADALFTADALARGANIGTGAVHRTSSKSLSQKAVAVYLSQPLLGRDLGFITQSADQPATPISTGSRSDRIR
ncbi:MAG: hypothetical protein GX483_01055 [Actinomycetaceae bacterium]|nr:hypothetical protein [Actinomycetaceae bacterium]